MAQTGGSERLARIEFVIEGSAQDIKELKSDLDKVDAKYVRIEVFDIRMQRVEAIVYGAAGLVLSSVLLALIYLVVTK